VQAALFDLLSAVMNSHAIWTRAAGDEGRGLAWRDATTRRITTSAAYAPYEELVVAATAEVGLPGEAAAQLFELWPQMEPWRDTAELSALNVPYAFVTNCSRELAQVAADRSGLSPRFVLSAEEAGWYKPDPRIYHEACARLASPRESTLFVAGSGYDAEGARAAGLQAVLVARRADERAVHDIASLEEVATRIATSGSSPC
jgi:2-haloacid dehalogenase